MPPSLRPSTGRVNDNVQNFTNVRTGPSTSQPIAFRMDRGSTCTVHGEVAGELDASTPWYEVEQDGQRIQWIEPLTQELMRRQGEDGSFRNRHSFVKEDDPLIATALATAALAASRLVPIPHDFPFAALD